MKIKPDPLATIREELVDYERQRTAAQADIDAANQSIAKHNAEAQRHQNLAGQANAKFIHADGAFQACQALLAKLSSQPDDKGAPAS